MNILRERPYNSDSLWSDSMQMEEDSSPKSNPHSPAIDLNSTQISEQVYESTLTASTGVDLCQAASSSDENPRTDGATVTKENSTTVKKPPKKRN